jgi:glycosyltransferase involved in cell wall biosynthesis
MKILTLNHEFPPVGGGAAPMSLQLAKYLVSMGHHVDVITMRWKNLPKKEVINGVTVYRTPAIRARPDLCRTHEMATYLPGAIGKAYHLARKNHYDVIHTHFIIPGSPLGWIIKKLCGIPQVVTCHGSDVPGYNPDRFKLVHTLIKPAWRFLARRADTLVCPSQSLKNLILQHCPDVRVRVIANGIDIDKFSPLTATRKKQILMCSRMLPRKGFQYLFEAARDLPQGWEIHLVGDGPYRPDLEKLAQGSKTPILFHGWLDHKDALFTRLFEESSLFVFPSEAENFPTVLLEAMSAGLAVITSNAGGCPEVVGDAGIIIPSGDVAALRKSLLGLIENPAQCQSYSLAARKRAEQFAWPTIARQYLEIFEMIMHRK